MKRRIALILIVLLGASFSLSAQLYLDSRSAHRNPALSAFTPRGIFEMGVQTDVAGYNSAFALGDILQETWVIDLSQATDRSGSSGLRVGATANLGTHGVLRIAGVGFGGYTGLRSIAELRVPQEFLQLLSEGNLEDRSGTGDAIVEAHLEAGARATYDWRGWTFGLNAAPFIPVAYSGRGGFEFELETTESGFNAHAGVDTRVYSSVDLVAIQDGTIPDVAEAFGNGGVKVDLGLIRRDAADRPHWGVGLTDVTVVPATATSEFRVSGSYAASTEDAIQAFLDEEDPLELTTEEIAVEFLKEADERIFLAPGISGFYRFGLPFVDIIPHAHVVFSQTLCAVNPGVTIAGNRFPTNLLYFGIGRERPVWRAAAGLRIPLYVMEINLQVESTSPRILGVFGPDGLAASLDLRLGF